MAPSRHAASGHDDRRARGPTPSAHYEVVERRVTGRTFLRLRGASRSQEQGYADALPVSSQLCPSLYHYVH